MTNKGNPYHVPAGNSKGGQFTSGQLNAIENSARETAGLPVNAMIRKGTGKIFINFPVKFPKYEEITNPKNTGVLIEDLYPTQDNFNMSGVNLYAAGKGQFQQEDINVVKQGDKYLIIDGHHRAAAAILNARKAGQSYIVVRLVGIAK